MSSVICEHETMIDKAAADIWEKLDDKCAVIFVSHYHCNAEAAWNWHHREMKGDIFAALQVPPHCIITADGRLGPQKTAENSLFLWSSRIGRQVAGEFKIQDATHLKEKMRLFKKDKGTRLLVIRSGLWRKFVSSSQIFTDPFSLAPGQTHPHYSSWWPRHSVPWCHRFQEPANEERGFDQLTSENTGRESEALLTARLWCVLRKLQGIHQIVSHMFVRQQYSRIFTRDLCLELVIQSRYQRKSSLKVGKLEVDKIQ